MVRRLVALFLLAMLGACTVTPTAPPAESGGIATSGG
jgi:hypothetical protein